MRSVLLDLLSWCPPAALHAESSFPSAPLPRASRLKGLQAGWAEWGGGSRPAPTLSPRIQLVAPAGPLRCAKARSRSPQRELACTPVRARRCPTPACSRSASRAEANSGLQPPRALRRAERRHGRASAFPHSPMPRTPFPPRVARPLRWTLRPKDAPRPPAPSLGSTRPSLGCSPPRLLCNRAQSLDSV